MAGTVDAELKTDAEVKTDGDGKGGSEAKAKPEGKAVPEGEDEAVRTVEVEVEPTVCDGIELELEKIVLVPADPPFHTEPYERVSLRVSNDTDVAVTLDSGTEATFLDERRTVIKADLHQSDWFMPLRVPAKSAVVVQIVVPQDSGKALRTVEVEASPADEPFSDCKLVDGLLEAKPGAAAEVAPAAPVAPGPGAEPVPIAG